MNIVLSTEAGAPVIKLIDFDASARHGEPCHLKYSSAFAPPQLAAELLEYEEYEAGLAEGDEQVPWAEWSKARGNLIASPQVDIWAFGALAFKMAVKDGASIFHSTEADNIVKREDLETLAHKWEERKLTEVSRLVWASAQDLVLWCLQTDQARRPTSFKDVLDHPFLGGKGSLHFLGDAHGKALEVFTKADADGNGTLDMDEAVSLLDHVPDSIGPAELERLKLDGSAITFDAFFEWFVKDSRQTLRHMTERWATELHATVQEGDVEKVKGMFAAGGVHYCLQKTIDGKPSPYKVTPLHRATYHGHLDIVRFLLNEVHPQTLSAVLDAQTKLGYSAHMLACESGYTEIAALLESKGCDVELRNNAGKTGSELAAAAARHEEQADLTPFRHGHGLHLGCESLESYLDLREKMLDDDVAAGIRLWNTKQSVYHFDKGAMEQLEAAVKALQAKSLDVSVSLR